MRDVVACATSFLALSTNFISMSEIYYVVCFTYAGGVVRERFMNSTSLTPFVPLCGRTSQKNYC